MPDQLDPPDDGLPPMPPPDFTPHANQFSHLPPPPEPSTAPSIPGAPAEHVTYVPMTETEALDIDAKLRAETARLNDKIAELQADTDRRQREHAEAQAELHAAQAEYDAAAAARAANLDPAEQIKARIDERIREANEIVADPENQLTPVNDTLNIPDPPELIAEEAAAFDAAAARLEAAAAAVDPAAAPQDLFEADVLERKTEEVEAKAEAAYDGRQTALGRWQEAQEVGASPERLRELAMQYAACDEALTHYEGQLDLLDAAAQAKLERGGPDAGPDDPEAKADLDPHPSPPSGAGDAAEADMPEVGIDHTLALDMPDVALDHTLPADNGRDYDAEARAFADAQLAPRGIPISELAQMQITPDMSSAQRAAIISSRTFPDAHASSQRTAHIQASTRTPKAAKLAKTLKRGGRR